jgi:acyl carrier protein
MAQVAREHGTSLISLDDDIPLPESGLDSLGIAVLIARLEDHLGIDPFRTSEDGHLPATIGDFVRAYEALLSGGDGSRDKPNKG